MFIKQKHHEKGKKKKLEIGSKDTANFYTYFANSKEISYL